MPQDDSESRKIACRAVQLAHTTKGYREWKMIAMEKLQRCYSTLTLPDANCIFDAHVLDLSKTVRKKRELRSGFEEDFFFDFVTATPDGDAIYFEFTLDEDDPADPTIWIVSVHPPGC